VIHALLIISTTKPRRHSPAQVRVALTPWSGRSVKPERDPDAPVRNLPFGPGGMITYLILDRDQRVDILLITWP
jgi:hypothetical protein